MTQSELEERLDGIISSCTGIKSDTSLFYELTGNIGYEAENNTNKNFIALNHSFKLKNIEINLKNIVTVLTENVLAYGMTYDAMDAYKWALLVLMNITKLCTGMIVKLDEDMVRVVRYLHKQNAYKVGIPLGQLTQDVRLKRKVEDVLDDLVRYKSIVVNNNSIILCEKVIIHNKKEKQHKSTKVSKKTKK